MIFGYYNTVPHVKCIKVPFISMKKCKLKFLFIGKSVKPMGIKVGA